ncbi:hypothetical protein GCM10022262_34330 [Georgenia daeguensis]|uniref:Uncharacterized protein n=1 Tax=Georgenia daeguensis TaxID=908355 RepID=A0ABP8EZ28_9MICO
MTLILKLTPTTGRRRDARHRPHRRPSTSSPANTPETTGDDTRRIEGPPAGAEPALRASSQAVTAG